MERPTMLSLAWKDVFLISALLFVLASPIPVIAFSVFNYDVLDRGVPPPPKKSKVYTPMFESRLRFSGGLLTIGLGVALWRSHRIWCLGKRGVVVIGRVVAVSSFTYKGARDITYAFEFQGRTIQERESIPTVSTRFGLNAEVHVLVDNQNPRRYMLL